MSHAGYGAVKELSEEKKAVIASISLHQNHFITFCAYRFAAAVVDSDADWWVMNVVPIKGPNTLPIIYERGLLGVAHDW